jgi:transcriptional regulator with XRE-family HTH domain
MTNFGASLKKARESKGISLDQIAIETRISSRFLTAIENEEFHLLPGGIFNRGFVRAYAEQVGIDPDQAVADYERIAGIAEPAQTTAAAVNPPAARIERNLYAIAIGALVLLVVLFYLLTRDSDKAQSAAPGPAQIQAPAPAPQTVEAAPEPEPPPPPETLSLELVAKQATWIKITTDGNTVVSGEILEVGMTRKFTAQNSIDLTIGNAAGLNLKINDMLSKPLGRAGQVRELNITQDNFKDFTG